MGTHWVAFYVQNNNNNNNNNNSVTFFYSFGVEHIPKEIKEFINHPLSSALQNNNKFFRIQAYDPSI